MTNKIKELLRHFGIEYPEYRELAQEERRRKASEKWPLLRATDRVFAQLRWRREKGDSVTELLEATSPPKNVARLADRRGQEATPAPDWFVTASKSS
ncbi:MAG: hypothetical protein KC635_03950 [Myxococcales bacterium]|nr:hypothetical protein [Myxococcales bacterium]MCB9736515.1 hypothetical protein [Deltaproteobacteria bacterium]